MDWNDVEKQINITIDFLRENILLSPYKQNDPIKCSDCLFRLIAILIVSGKIKVSKILYKNNSIWCNPTPLFKNDYKSHGAHWHDSTIRIISNYFKNNGYVYRSEPSLHFGRADIGIDKLKLFIEIGTISLYKLYFNLINIKNCKIIIVPNDNYLIEFTL